jgi:hypothetical protein
MNQKRGMRFKENQCQASSQNPYERSMEAVQLDPWELETIEFHAPKKPLVQDSKELITPSIH